MKRLVLIAALISSALAGTPATAQDMAEASKNESRLEDTLSACWKAAATKLATESKETADTIVTVVTGSKTICHEERGAVVNAWIMVATRNGTNNAGALLGMQSGMAAVDGRAGADKTDLLEAVMSARMK